MSVQSSQRFSIEKVQSCGLDISKEQIQSLNNGESVLIFHHKPYYSRPSDTVANSDIDIHQLNKGQDLKIGNYIQMVRNEVLVIKKIAKKTQLPKDKVYCGSITGLATLIDVFQNQSGEFYIENNLWTSWNNSQEWNETIRDFSFRRYEIESAVELNKYNEIGAQKKEAQKNFFDTTLSMAIAVGIPKEKAIVIVNKTNVTVLEAITQLMFRAVPKKDAAKIANKGSAWNYAQVILRIDPKLITRKFDNLLSACREYANL